jgi:hypothetical protein
MDMKIIDFAGAAKTNPIQTQYKPNQTQFLTELLSAQISFVIPGLGTG